MAGSPSSRKVARAARAGGSRRYSSEKPYGWYSLLAVIVILGSFLVAYSRDERLDINNPGSTPPLASTPERPGDQWFEAYGVYLCDKFAPNLKPENDPYGITTADDGVISIAPIKREYAGHSATLGLFAKGVGMKIDRESVQLPGDEKKYGPGEKCGDKDGELVVKEWAKAADDKTGKVIDVNPNNLLLKNEAAITIAFVPKGEKNIPMPPSAAELAKAAAGDTPAPDASTTTTTAPGSTTTTTVAK